MADYKSTVGKNLLKILMFSMYHEPKTIYREYVQNALDSINDAVRQGILGKTKDGNISISINKGKRQIIIEDNGKGIVAGEVAKKLLNIADSYKDGITSAGQFGIGRLVGAGYCKNLVFETSSKGEEIKTKIEIDVDFVDQILKDNSDHSSANEVMDTVTKQSTFEEEKDSHYFRVILNDVKDTYNDLLDEDAVVDYLQEVGPIEYGMPFKNRFINNVDIIPAEYRPLLDNIPSVSISVNRRSDIRKRYGLKIEGTGDAIEGLEYFKINDSKFGDLAWGWYALTKFSTQIPASDKNKGLRLRKHNIQIGDSESLSSFFTETRGNHYFYGEVHIINDKVEPDSGRSGLAPTPESECLKNMLKDEFVNLKNLYVLANRAKNVVKAVSELTKKAADESFPPEERQTSKNNIETEQAKFTKIEDKAQTNSSSSKLVELYKKDLVEIKKPSKGETTPQLKDSPKAQEEQTSAPPKVTDIFAPLKGVLSDKETFVVRRIFKSLTDNCPEQNKKLLEELKIMVIKDLTKAHGR